MRTVGVCGRYWISSNTGVRRTTAPGVTARSVPTWKASLSTIAGVRGELARSLTRCRGPVTRLAPPVSMTAFQPTGLSSGLLLGAAASTRLVATNLTRSASRHGSGTSCTRPSTVPPAAR